MFISNERNMAKRFYLNEPLLGDTFIKFSLMPNNTLNELLDLV